MLPLSHSGKTRSFYLSCHMCLWVEEGNLLSQNPAALVWNLVRCAMGPPTGLSNGCGGWRLVWGLRCPTGALRYRHTRA